MKLLLIKSYFSPFSKCFRAVYIFIKLYMYIIVYSVNISNTAMCRRVIYKKNKNIYLLKTKTIYLFSYFSSILFHMQSAQFQFRNFLKNCLYIFFVLFL